MKTVRRLVDMRMDGKMLGQLSRFGVVGALATATHFVVAIMVHHGVGLPAYLANTIAFLVAFGVSYGGHFSWTFAGQGNHRRSVLRFAVTAFAMFVLNQIILMTMIEGFAAPFALALGVALLVVPAVTFAMAKFWVFRPDLSMKG